jgi:membrane protein required for colicin V production
MLDVILLVVVGVFMIRGLFRGFIRETLGLVALVAAGLVAALYAAPAGEALQAREAVRPEAAPAVAAAGLFVGTYVAVNLIGLVADRLARALFLGPLLRLAGMLFAALKGALLLGLALVAGQRFVPAVLTPGEVEASRLAGPLMDFATVVLELGGGWIDGVVEATEGVGT